MHYFSVLLSIYAKEKVFFLKQCFDSILSQTLLPSEIVLVKDGPLTDDLNKFIDQYVSDTTVRFKIVELKFNRGLGNALCEGLKHCSYEIVARMDTDDIAKPTRFEQQMEIFESKTTIDVVGAWVDEFIDENVNKTISIRRLPENSAEIYRFAKRRNPINHPTVMFRKESVLAVGGYSDFLLFEDYYLWIRMLANGCVFYNIQESLLFFRISHDVYKRRGGWKYAINESKLRKKMLNLGLISHFNFLLETPLRFFIRIIPSSLRRIFYLKILR